MGSEALMMDALRAALRVSVAMSAPILATALVVGAAVGLLQALTSVQEATLTFVPKLAAMLAVFWLGMALMTQQLVDLFQGTILPLVAGG